MVVSILVRVSFLLPVSVGKVLELPLIFPYLLLNPSLQLILPFGPPFLSADSATLKPLSTISASLLPFID